MKQFFLAFFVLSVTTAHAAESFDYPELSVTPRASERLEMEAKREADREWTRYLPFQASAAATLFAGFIQSSNQDLSKDSGQTSQWAGLAVGGTWLAVTLALSVIDEPYTKASREVGSMPKKTLREQLTRERVAEELIQRRGSLGRTLKWLSFATNVFAGAYMISKGNERAQAFDAVALAFSVAPLLFRPHWQDVAEEQSEYKKRIYAPVAGLGLTAEPISGKPTPSLQVLFRF